MTLDLAARCGRLDHRRILEINVVERDRGRRRDGRHRIIGNPRIFLRLGGQADDFLDTTERSQRLVDRVDGPERGGQRHDHHEQEQDERHEACDGDGLACHPEAADAEDHEQCHLQRDPGDGHDERGDLRHRDPHVPCTLRILLDRGDLTIRGVGCPNCPDRAEGTFDGGGKIAHLLLLLAAGDADATREQHHGHDRDRDDEHGQPE